MTCGTGSSDGRHDASEAVTEASGSCRAGSKVLLADDNEGVRILLAGILESAGYKVTLACDGRDALDLFEASPDGFSALVLDIVMPRLGGDEVYRAVRASGQELGVVFVSGFGGDAVAREALTDQAIAFVEKPFAHERLLAALVGVGASPSAAAAA